MAEAKATANARLCLSDAELLEKLDRHGVLLDALQEGVLMVDRLGRVLAANPAAQRILDPDGPDLAGRC